MDTVRYCVYNIAAIEVLPLPGRPNINTFYLYSLFFFMAIFKTYSCLYQIPDKTISFLKPKSGSVHSIIHLGKPKSDLSLNILTLSKLFTSNLIIYHTYIVISFSIVVVLIYVSTTTCHLHHRHLTFSY